MSAWTIVLGFLGGLGAVIVKGAIDAYFDRRREKGALRAAARLVGHELGTASIRLDAILEVGRWMTWEGLKFDHDVWHQNKGLLASALNGDQWFRVARGYREVQAAEANASVAARIAGVPEPPVDSDLVQLLQHGRAAIDRAAQVLADVSE